MAPRKPGRGFWIRVRLADFFAPGTGTHRINDKLQEVYEDGELTHRQNDALIQEVQFLRRQLLCAEGQKNLLLTQDTINEAAQLATSFVNKKLPTSIAEESPFGRTTIP